MKTEFEGAVVAGIPVVGAAVALAQSEANDDLVIVAVQK